MAVATDSVVLANQAPPDAQPTPIEPGSLVDAAARAESATQRLIKALCETNRAECPKQR